MTPLNSKYKNFLNNIPKPRLHPALSKKGRGEGKILWGWGGWGGGVGDSNTAGSSLSKFQSKHKFVSKASSKEKSERLTLAGCQVSWRRALGGAGVGRGVVGIPRSRAHQSRAGEPRHSPVHERPSDRITQGSVQIVLIFRLLLKITVDWPFHAISLSL